MADGLSEPPSTSAYGLTLTGGTVVDAKFLSSELLLVLWCPSGKNQPPHLVVTNTIC